MKEDTRRLMAGKREAFLCVVAALALGGCGGSAKVHEREANGPKAPTAPVPIHACVVSGAPWAPAGKLVTAKLAETMDAVNAIWKSADISFVIPGEARLIPDPQPPGMRLDAPPYVVKGQPGDIRLGDELGEHSDEFTQMQRSCNAAWSAGNAPSESGLTVIFIRELLRTYGELTPHGSVSTDLPSGSTELDFCASPYSISPSRMAGRWSVIGTFDRGVGDAPPNLATRVAHELGHLLLLVHGDGVDEDGDGTWDENCDFDEPNTGTSLMDEMPGRSTTITPLQRALAQAAANAVLSAKSQ
jgi:hypothetical protein